MLSTIVSFFPQMKFFSQDPSGIHVTCKKSLMKISASFLFLIRMHDKQEKLRNGFSKFFSFFSNFLYKETTDSFYPF